MQHRHLTSKQWSLAAIDSALERGQLPHWRELFAAAEGDRQIAEKILTMAAAPGSTGGALARELVFGLYPELRTGVPKSNR